MKKAYVHPTYLLFNRPTEENFEFSCIWKTYLVGVAFYERKSRSIDVLLELLLIVAERKTK